jgi:hypothetical protein
MSLLHVPDWRGVSVPGHRDVRRLMPPSLPRKLRFETQDDAIERNTKRVDELCHRLPGVADDIDQCDPVTGPCNMPACASCARDYRIYATSELLKIADQFEGPHEIATAHLATVNRDRLVDVDLALEHDKFRKRLQRAGFGNSLLIGGTEAAWKKTERVWILHVHLLAIGVSSAQWDGLLEALGDTGTEFPLKYRTLKQEVRGISYLTKFATYHRPLPRLGSSPSRPYPLPPARLVELVEWWDKYDFETFLFLFGARRRGGRFVPEI